MTMKDQNVVSEKKNLTYSHYQVTLVWKPYAVSQ